MLHDENSDFCRLVNFLVTVDYWVYQFTLWLNCELRLLVQPFEKVHIPSASLKFFTSPKRFDAGTQYKLCLSNIRPQHVGGDFKFSGIVDLIIQSTPLQTGQKCVISYNLFVYQSCDSGFESLSLSKRQSIPLKLGFLGLIQSVHPLSPIIHVVEFVCILALRKKSLTPFCCKLYIINIVRLSQIMNTHD